jgi:hypothetical protein
VKKWKRKRFDGKDAKQTIMDIKVSCSEWNKKKTTQSIGAEQQVKNTRANKGIEGLPLDDDDVVKIFTYLGWNGLDW